MQQKCHVTLMFQTFSLSMSWILLLGSQSFVEIANGFPSREHRCESLATKKVCLEQVRGHNLTSMPNLLDHENQLEAEDQMTSFQPLMMYGCSRRLELFLCSAHFPYCAEKVPTLVIGPCHGLCESVRESCEPILNHFGFHWPESLECSRFPKLNDVNQMCVEGPADDVMEMGSSHHSSKQSLLFSPKYSTVKTVKIQFCSHLKSSESYLPTNIAYPLIICSRKCSSHVAFEETQKKLADKIYLIIVVLCSSISLAALLTAILSKEKLTNHQKLLLHVIICTIFSCLALVIRFLIGRETSSCQQVTNNSFLLSPSSTQLDDLPFVSVSSGYPVVIVETCFALFGIHFFGVMASCSWFTVATLLWCFHPRYLELHKNNKRIDFKSWNYDETNSNSRKAKLCVNFLKMASWGFPIILCSCVVLSGDVSGDELFGFCFVSPEMPVIYVTLYVVPLCNFCILMIVFTFVGLVKRWRKIRREKFSSQPSLESVRKSSKIFYVFKNSQAFPHPKRVDGRLGNFYIEEEKIKNQVRSNGGSSYLKVMEVEECKSACDCLVEKSEYSGSLVADGSRTRGKNASILENIRQKYQQIKSTEKGPNNNWNKNNNNDKHPRHNHHDMNTYEGGITCLLGSLSFIILAVSSLIELTNHDALYRHDSETSQSSVSGLMFWVSILKMSSLMSPGIICSSDILLRWTVKQNMTTLREKSNSSKCKSCKEKHTTSEKIQDDDVNKMEYNVNDEGHDIVSSGEERHVINKMTHQDVKYKANNVLSKHRRMTSHSHIASWSGFGSSLRHHHPHHHNHHHHRHRQEFVADGNRARRGVYSKMLMTSTSNSQKQQQGLVTNNKYNGLPPTNTNKILLSNYTISPNHFQHLPGSYHHGNDGGDDGGDNDDDDDDDDGDDDYDEEMIAIMKSVVTTNNDHHHDHEMIKDDEEDRHDSNNSNNGSILQVESLHYHGYHALTNNIQPRDRAVTWSRHM